MGKYSCRMDDMGNLFGMEVTPTQWLLVTSNILGINRPRLESPGCGILQVFDEYQVYSH